jgi:Xaa-Pro aminopeptidase
MKKRLAQFRARFKALKIDAFLVTFLPHVRYLSGFSGSSGACIVTKHGAAFFTDGRYAAQVKKEVRGWKVHITPDTIFSEIKRTRTLRAGTRIGFDGNTLLYHDYSDLKKFFPGVRFLPKANVVDDLAAVKDAAEISLLKKAISITDKTFSDLLPMIKPGVRELEIAAEISYIQRTYGAEGDAFDTIVASGVRSALPHGRATTKKIARGDLVTLDFGCVYEGYHSDMTRTVAVGRASSEAKKIYHLVLEAQERAIESARAGQKTKDLDAVARNIIRKGGYDRYFRHSLGHGIGLQIHEAPRISVQGRGVLETGNVVTIEPGIYLPGVGGVRIEDDVLIKEGGCSILNRSPKKLLIL